MWSLVGVVTLALTAQAPEAGAPPPAPDVAQVEELFRVVRRDAPKEPVAAAELERAVGRALTRSAEQVLREVGVVRGAAELEAAGTLRERLAALARRKVAALPAADAPQRRAALEALAREATSRVGVGAEVDAWLGHAPARAEAPEAAQAGPDAATRELLAGRQVDGRVDAGELRLGRVQVVEELGGNPAGAGLVETGEWVKLSLELHNPSPQPWFSTTAFPDVAGGCIWVDRLAPQVAGEMSPAQHAPLQLWVYVAPGCPAGMSRSFALVLRDTHRGDAAPARMRVFLRPLDLAPPRVARAQLDVDELGSSDGSRVAELKPGVRFELVTDLSLPAPDARTLRVLGYAAPADARGILARSEFRSEPEWPRAADGLFRAWDDLDGEVVGTERFRDALGTLQASRAWLATGQQGRLWLAVDVDVTWEGAPETVPAASDPATPPAPRGRRAGAEASTSDASTATRPPATAAVLGLVREFVSLAPRPVPPSIKGATEAVSGYELVVDEAAFGQAYEELWARPAAAATAAPAPRGPPRFHYRTRLYHAVPVLAFLPPSPAPTPAPVVAEPRAAPQPAERQPSRWVTVDAGLGALLGVELTAPSTTPLYWGGETSTVVPEWHLRATIGPRELVGFAGVRSGSRDIEGNAPSVSVLTGVLGGGYRMALDASHRNELVPSLAFNFQSREAGTQAPTHTSLALEFGVTFRHFFTDHVGLHLDAAWRVDSAGPTYQRATLVDPSGPRLAAGLSLRN